MSKKSINYYHTGSGPQGIEELKRHPFFASISWENLYARKVSPPFKPVVRRTGMDEAFYFDTEFTSRRPRG